MPQESPKVGDQIVSAEISRLKKQRSLNSVQNGLLHFTLILRRHSALTFCVVR
jgi:hypothetical protein